MAGAMPPKRTGMVKEMTPKERLLATLEFKPTDYTPCCIPGWSSLYARSKGLADYTDNMLKMGVDTVVRVSEIDVRMRPEVTTREWLEPAPAGEPYPILHKEYRTPVGTLATSVNKSAEWPHGDHVPIWDDFLISHSKKFLVTPQDNLEALKYILGRPNDADLKRFRDSAANVKRIADERNLPMMAAYVMMGDMANWLAGIQELLIATVDDPKFVHALLDIVEDWNIPFIQESLSAGADLIVRRGWYENADFWSPRMYREFLLPGLARQAEMVHRGGAKFGYLVSCSTMPLIDMFVEAGVDVLLGIDPAQDLMMNYDVLKQKTAGKMALWGGVCGYLTVECGSEDDIRREVRLSMDKLAPGGGFILAPMTNIRDGSDRSFRNADAMIAEWKKLRASANAK